MKEFEMLVGIFLGLAWWIVSIVSSLTRLEGLILLCTVLLLLGLGGVTKAIVALQERLQNVIEQEAAQLIVELRPDREDEDSEWVG
jgi:hypothetical protein